MRFNKDIFDSSQSRTFIGNNAPYARVTVDPYWSLKKTPPIYGNSFRGPYRYYTDGNPIEYEVPSIKSVSWDRSNDQDLATCTIEIYNSWHNLNHQAPELAGQLGNKGYFWPKRGQGDSSVQWNQTPGRGAYKKDGTWDSTFSWENVLVEDVIVRTWEGYGIAPVSGDFTSIQQHVNNEEAFLTGVWIVNTVTAGSNGILTLSCTDIGRLLLDQIVFPPVIPPTVYPLEYYPPGKTAFDSPWGPAVKDVTVTNEIGQQVSTSPASKGEVWIRSATSTASNDSTVKNLHPASHAIDGNWDTYAMSQAFDEMNGGRPYFEFLPGATANSGPPPHNSGTPIDSMQLRTWGGGYTVYISIAEDEKPYVPGVTLVWRGENNIPGGGIKYVKKIEVPLYLPDGMEKPINIDFADFLDEDDDYDREALGPNGEPWKEKLNTYYAHKVRLTFENLYYSHIPDGTKRYRCGIRDFILYRNGSKVNPYTSSINAAAWTFAMDQHPSRGYWIADSSGNVYGFGDAANYDTTAFGQISLAGDSTNKVVGLAAHPSGEGYWVVDWMGNVYAQGVAQYYGEYTIPSPLVYPNPANAAQMTANNQSVAVRGIAATHTGNGYWVLYSNGVIRGFGDATPNYATVPSNVLATFMDIYLVGNYETYQYVRYSSGLMGTAIASHPKKMGFWVSDGSGQVFSYGACQGYGGLIQREYKKGLSGEFKLQPREWATSIESTVSGEGYWIAFGSGRVASFGDATKIGPDPYVFEKVDLQLPDNILTPDTDSFDPWIFRDILWSIARDPDGTGFWALKANGDVAPIEAEFWGKPGYDGAFPTGYRWHDGNFDGGWENIVKEILMWGGFLFYDNNITSTESPAVLGSIESTGIKTDTNVSPDKFDKKTLIDVIKELTEVVGYRFYIDEEGRAVYSSPNWWSAGNFDQDGIRIFVDNDGNRVAANHPEAQPFIPLIHEDDNMLSYSATLSSTDKRSEIIIGTDLPDAKDPTRTSWIRHVPPHALESVAGGVNTMRGIERTAVWSSQLFENEEERRLMAELIGLHSWFASRTGSVDIVANPLLSIGDQIRLVERNTSETFIHLINSINSSLDNDSGVYTMSLSTNWLGNADNWVLATEPKESEYIYTVISERLNSWQNKTNRGLAGGGSFDEPIIFTTGAFTTSIAEAGSQWEFEGEIKIDNSVNNLIIEVDILSNLTNPVYMEIYQGAALIKNYNLTHKGQTLPVGSFANPTTLTYKIVGTVQSKGLANLKLNFKSGSAFVDLSVISKMVVLGDSISDFDSTYNGITGPELDDRWHDLLKNSGVVFEVYNGAKAGYTTEDLINDPIIEPGDVSNIEALVIFIGANDQNESLSGVSPVEFYNNIITLMQNYPAPNRLVVFPWKWTGYPWTEPDPAPTLLEYNTYAQKAKEAAIATGSQFLHIGEIVEALAAANNQVGWGQYLLDWIHPSALGHQFLASRIGEKLRSPNLSDLVNPANNLSSVHDSIVFLEAPVSNE